MTPLYKNITMQYLKILAKKLCVVVYYEESILNFFQKIDNEMAKKKSEKNPSVYSSILSLLLRYFENFFHLLMIDF